MMNKSQLAYCDFVFNPVTGCLHGCENCYAMSFLRRFSGDVRINKGSPQLSRITKDLYVLPNPFKNSTGGVIPSPAGTTPTLHEYRLRMPAQKKKPANIFVCSMADLFGEWVPDEWIEKVFSACEAAPWHNYLFLTKNPKRYDTLLQAGSLPQYDNFWYGSTLLKPDDPIFSAKGYKTFINIEPLKTSFKGCNFNGASWVIIRVETGGKKSKIKPEREWIKEIISTCRKGNLHIFMVESQELREVWTECFVQEIPEVLYRPPDPPLPHCTECHHAIGKEDGKRGRRCYCSFGIHPSSTSFLHVKGRYTRTSPPWCALRQTDATMGTQWEQKNEQTQKKKPRGIIEAGNAPKIKKRQWVLNPSYRVGIIQKSPKPRNIKAF